jgi:hypothetical protein
MKVGTRVGHLCTPDSLSRVHALAIQSLLRVMCRCHIKGSKQEAVLTNLRAWLINRSSGFWGHKLTWIVLSVRCACCCCYPSWYSWWCVLCALRRYRGYAMHQTKQTCVLIQSHALLTPTTYVDALYLPVRTNLLVQYGSATRTLSTPNPAMPSVTLPCQRQVLQQSKSSLQNRILQVSHAGHDCDPMQFV